MQCSLVFISDAYIKGCLNMSLEQLKERLLNLSKKENIEMGEACFSLLKKILEIKDLEINKVNDDMFFFLLFKSINWIYEKKPKSAKKVLSMKDIKFKRDPNLFSSLLMSLSSFLLRKHEISEDDIKNKSIKYIKYEYDYSTSLNLISTFFYLK